MTQYDRDQVLVPCVLRKNVFPIMAKDNIDLNAKSTMVKTHCHSTSLTVAQCPKDENDGEPLPRTYKDDGSGSKKLSGLPKEYADVAPLPAYHTGKALFAPLCTINLPDYVESNIFPALNESIEMEYEWPKKFTPPIPEDTGQSWARFHASRKRNKNATRGTNAIFPMIKN